MRSRAYNTRQHQNHTTPSATSTLSQGDFDSSNNMENRRTLLLQRNVLLVLCTILLLVVLKAHWRSSSLLSCEISLGEYKGPVYHSVESGTVGMPHCLLDSKWMRVSLHSVKFPGSVTTYDDWMWIDYHDRINVLVEDERLPGEDDDREPSFLVFEQTKYALEGRNSLAIIGGIIEVGEDPISAARREIEEEMNGLVCENIQPLGRYRTDVNRGMGWLNGFLATKCSRRAEVKKKHFLANEVGVADTEKQNLKSLTLTELRQAAQQGKFIEVQWTATVSQALLKFYSSNSSQK